MEPLNDKVHQFEQRLKNLVVEYHALKKKNIDLQEELQQIKVEKDQLLDKIDKNHLQYQDLVTDFNDLKQTLHNLSQRIDLELNKQ